MVDLKNWNSPKFVAKEVYGYVIISSLAVGIALIGVFLIYLEQRKHPDERNPGKVIIGICVSAAGSLVMILSLFYLLARG